MKVIYSLVCFFLLLVLACANEPSASTENNNTPVTVVAPETPVESSSAKERSSVIEKEPAPNVEVAPINYITLADAYCKCAAHTVSINEKLKQLNGLTENTISIGQQLRIK